MRRQDSPDNSEGNPQENNSEESGENSSSQGQISKELSYIGIIVHKMLNIIIEKERQDQIKHFCQKRNVEYNLFIQSIQRSFPKRYIQYGKKVLEDYIVKSKDSSEVKSVLSIFFIKYLRYDYSNRLKKSKKIKRKNLKHYRGSSKTIIDVITQQLGQIIAVTKKMRDFFASQVLHLFKHSQKVGSTNFEASWVEKDKRRISHTLEVHLSHIPRAVLYNGF